jgi:hypothetical protein
LEHDDVGDITLADCNADVACEIDYYTLVKLDEIQASLVNVDRIAQNGLGLLLAICAFVIAWNFLKSVF